MGRALSWLVAVVLLAGTAGLVLAGRQAPAATSASVVPVTETVAPGALTLACPGPLTLGTAKANNTDLTYDPAFQPVKGSSSLTLSATALSPGNAAPTASLTPLGGGKPAVFSVSGQTSAASLTAPKSGSVLSATATPAGAPEVTGASVTTTEDGDLRGLAGATCVAAQADSYLVGGDTRAASAATLVLTNLGATAAQVSLTVWGVAGKVDTGAGTEQIVVPDHAQRAFRIGGVAPDEQRIVVRVEVTGGEVASYLQDSRLDGLNPAGVDLVTASAAPGTEAVIPAIHTAATTADSPNPAFVRLLAPGKAAGTATIELYGKDGRVDVAGLDKIALEPGIVSDVPLRSVAAGDYVAVVKSSVPMVAAASLSDPVTKAAAVDRAWVPAQAPAKEGLVPLSPGISANISLTALSRATGTLQPIGKDGKAGRTTKVTIDGTAAHVLDAGTLGVADAQAVRYQFDQPVAIAAGMTKAATGGNLITVLAPTASRAGQTTVKVGTGVTLGLS